MSWQEGRILRSDEVRAGWMLPVPGGLLGPSDLFHRPPGARDEGFALRIQGDPAVVPENAEDRESGLTYARIPRGDSVWPVERMRLMSEAEDCLVVTDAAAAPLALSAVRLESDGDYWAIDPAISFSRSTHGAAVVARSDGQVVGLLLVDEDGARVAPIQ